MAIQTSTFGGVHLSGEDARKFLNQVRYGRPKQATKDAYARGLPMVQEFMEKGYSTINLYLTVQPDRYAHCRYQSDS